MYTRDAYHKDVLLDRTGTATAMIHTDLARILADVHKQLMCMQQPVVDCQKHCKQGY